MCISNYVNILLKVYQCYGVRIVEVDNCILLMPILKIEISFDETHYTFGNAWMWFIYRNLFLLDGFTL